MKVQIPSTKQGTPSFHTTPMNVQAFAEELTSHPDKSFVSKLLTDLREGFRIGYAGPQFSGEAPNQKSAICMMRCN